MSFRTISTLSLVLAVFSSAAPGLAQPMGTAFTYQGELRSAGLPASGPHDMRFRLYGALSGGAQLGNTLCFDHVPLSEGRFTVSLDFGAVFAGQSRYLEIDVRPDTGLGCASASGFTPLTPRQPVAPAPHALFALSAAAATTALSAANATQLNGQPASFYQNASNLTTGTIASARLPIPLSLGGSVDFSAVILGANNSTSGYGVFGYSLPASGETYGVGGDSSSADGTGVLGVASAASGDTRGVQGVSYSPVGRGVLGVSNAMSGYTVGVQGESAPGNPTGTGVVGKAQATGGWFEATGTSGTGLYGVASNTGTGSTDGVQGRSASQFGVGVRGVATHGNGVTYGGRFESSSNAGVGVIGYATATSGETEGVFGRSDSPDGRGVFGLADAPTGTTYGGRFESNSTTSGRGVFGLATAVSGYTVGVQGGSASTSGRGVYGYASAPSGNTIAGLFTNSSTSGTAVYGWASAETGSTYGVVGQRSSTIGMGYAVYAEGDLGATGFKSFRIDHPADPANKYLLHYCIESPEVLNAYSGNATLDGAGEATVPLPKYFALVNRDPRYTLTPIGAAMPLLHVADEVSAEALAAGEVAEPGQELPPCSFRIAGGVPGGRVSWRVEAVRNDRWMCERGAPVEVAKEGRERGKYQNPEFYGQPPQMGMNYGAERLSSRHE